MNNLDQMQELIDQLNYYTKLYDEGNPEIDDKTWDTLYFQLQEMEKKSGIILANTYHLWLEPGEDIVSKAGGLHKFMNYDGPILTDSGGYQVFSLAKPKDINDEGVKFKNHLNGDELFLTPEKSIDIQNKLGSDFVMSFDECVKWPCERKYIEKSVFPNKL